MLTLSGLETAVRELEDKTFGVNRGDLRDWTYIVSWFFYIHPYNKLTDAELDELSNIDVIMSFELPNMFCHKFITSEWSETRVLIALDNLFNWWIDEKKMDYQFIVSTRSERMADLNELMSNEEWWQPYYEEIAKEREEQMKKPDVDWQEVLRQKQIMSQAVKQVLQEQQETVQERDNRIINMAKEKGFTFPDKTPERPPQKIEEGETRQQEIQDYIDRKNGHTQPQDLDSKSPVKIYYVGAQSDGSTQIKTLEGIFPVVKNAVYSVDAQMWHNLQTSGVFRQGDWQRVNE